MLVTIEIKSEIKIPLVFDCSIQLSSKTWSGKSGLYGWDPRPWFLFCHYYCATTWVQAGGRSLIALKDICVRSQNTLSNSCGNINKFKGHLQSDNNAFKLKEILIAADCFWVPRDSTQALNPLHKPITVALSTVAVMAVSHKINAFYYQKQSSPFFTCVAAPFHPDFASRE